MNRYDADKIGPLFADFGVDDFEDTPDPEPEDDPVDTLDRDEDRAILDAAGWDRDDA